QSILAPSATKLLRRTATPKQPSPPARQSFFTHIAIQVLYVSFKSLFCSSFLCQTLAGLFIWEHNPAIYIRGRSYPSASKNWQDQYEGTRILFRDRRSLNLRFSSLVQIFGFWKQRVHGVIADSAH